MSRRRFNATKVEVNHYWNKAANLSYGGEGERVMTEIILAALLTPVTLYCFFQDGLTLLSAGLAIPWLMFVMGASVSVVEVVKNKYFSNPS